MGMYANTLGEHAEFFVTSTFGMSSICYTVAIPA